jgi:hypothetical protein
VLKNLSLILRKQSVLKLNKLYAKTAIIKELLIVRNVFFLKKIKKFIFVLSVVLLMS